MLTIPILKLHPDAIIPDYAHPGDAWCDLCSLEAYTLQPGERHPFPTGLSLALPHGYYSRIAPRSGLAVKHGIDVLAWVIDAEYRGEYIVILLNTGGEPVEIVKGQKIAQLIIERCAQATFTRVEMLDDTLRADGARGSTGL